MTQQNKVGILGGTFDPIHNAHIHIGQQAVKQLQLDHCLLIPNNVPPHRKQPQASATDRVNMIELAISNTPCLQLSTCELERPGPSYMVDTLTELKQNSSSTEFTLIIGADSFNSFESWHRWQELVSLANLAVFQRPGHPINQDSELLKSTTGITLLDANLPVAATTIRQQLHNMRKINADDMPQKVIEYIESHGLYRN